MIDDYLRFIKQNHHDIFACPEKYISETEEAIGRYLSYNSGYAKLLGSWTTAIQFWLLLAWVRKGDEVILPANTYSATAIAITNIWAVPIFADIKLSDYTIDPESIWKNISPKTKAIIPVHIYGYPCDMDSILSIAKKYNISVIEDASHAFGWEYKWKKLWTIWDFGAFSCHSSKNFGTFGNGWLLWTPHNYSRSIQDLMYPDSLSENVVLSGRTPWNIGVLDAIVLGLKLRFIDTVINNNKQIYTFFLEKYSHCDFVFPDLDFENHKISIRNLVVLSRNRDSFIKKWLWRQYYSSNLSSLPYFCWGVNDKLENTELFFQQNLWLNYYFGILPIK